MTEAFICCACGELHPLEDRTVVDGQEFCRPCLEEKTLLCHACGRHILREDNAGDEDTPLCQGCYDRCYTNCTRCGVLLELEQAYYLRDDVDEEEPLCHSCYITRSGSDEIHNYYYKPDPIFYGEGTRYFGVELEIDGAGETNGHAQRLVEAAGFQGREHVYIKHDGSLENGLEIVTHPMTLSYHLTEMPWGDVVAEALHMGYTSHKSCTCGLCPCQPRRLWGHRDGAGGGDCPHPVLRGEPLERTAAVQPPHPRPDGAVGGPLWPEGQSQGGAGQCQAPPL